MKIFLDTADVDAIEMFAQTGLINGVTTNPSHLSKAGGDPVAVVKKICKILPKGEISVEVTEHAPQDVYKQALAISKLAKNVLVKVPCHRDYYEIIGALVRKNVNLNITLVFSLLQGLMMCKLGVRYISPFVGRLDDIDVDGGMLLHELRYMVDEYGFKTNILAASIRSHERFQEAILAGSDAITLPIDLFAQATTHVLTDKGIKKFNQDWKKLNISKFP